jgi:hypothetical protein
VDATKWFAGSATHSSAGCVKNALILRVHTYISGILLQSVTIFFFIECHIQMMRMMIGGWHLVYFLKIMMMITTESKILSHILKKRCELKYY